MMLILNEGIFIMLMRRERESVCVCVSAGSCDGGEHVSIIADHSQMSLMLRKKDMGNILTTSNDPKTRDYIRLHREFLYIYIVLYTYKIENIVLSIEHA